MRSRLVIVILALTALVTVQMGSPDSARSSGPVFWVDDQAYGSAGAGFYWDSLSNQVWTAERGWHLFAPAPPRTWVPLWVNDLSYGSAGGGFYWDPLSGQVWTSERGWHFYHPEPPPPAPITLSGTGQTATQTITLSGGNWFIDLAHDGARNFIVWSYKDGVRDDLLVNVIGRYSGRRWLPEGTYYFDIAADGKWSIKATPMNRQAAAFDALSGTGDVVSGLFDAPAGIGVVYEVTHNGQRNFIVWLRCGKGADLVQNVIGPVSGSTVADVPRNGGPCFWDVQADGAWSLKRR